MTPGPWMITDLDIGRWHEAKSGSGQFRIIPAKGELLRPSLAMVYHEADARLIATAPELLAACKAAFKFTQSSHDADVDLDLMLARAIAKAEGITT